MSLDAATIDRIRQGMTAVSLLFGLALLLGGGYFLERQRQFIARSVTAEGQVIENERVRGRSSSRSSYRAIVRFTDQHGEPVVYHDRVAFNPPSFNVGQSVTVFYDPQNPQMAMIDRGAKNFLIPGIAFGLGALITASWLPRLFRRT